VKRRISVALGAAIIFFLVHYQIVLRAQGNAAALVGVWRIAETITTGPDGKRNPSPQPGLLIFTKRHYSVTFVTSDSPRPELPATGATDRQRSEAFGAFDSVAGTYEVKGDQILFTRIVAKNPNAMRPGASATDTLRFEGPDTLWLTEPREYPRMWKLTRLE